MVEIDRPASLALCCLLAAGHLLVEDVPGVGKTTLAKVIARAIGGHDSRIQCTEDLTAVGVIGQEIESTNPSLRPDEFIPGPLFANAVVLDEFNRATPRMQSGLLEAMEEHAVTVGKRRHALPRPFFCIGTMNPHDNTGHVRDGARLLRPLRDAHGHRLPVRERRARPAHALRQRRDAHGERSDRRARRRRAAAEGDRAAAGRASPCAPISCACCAPRASTPTCSSAPRRARCSRCTAAPRRPRCSTTPPRSPSSTCAACSSRASRTASACGPEASARAVCEEILERTPVPVTTPPPTIAATEGSPRPGAPVQLAA